MSSPSPTRLLVLAVVGIFEEIHGYDVRRELLSWRADQWANVAPGSIYNALKSLERDGLLAIIGTEQPGGRPARTTYRITPEGRKEAASMLRELWWNVSPATDPLSTAIALLPLMDKGEVTAALHNRLKQLEATRDSCLYQLTTIGGDPTEGGIPAHVAEQLHLRVAHLEAEIGWATALIDRLDNGVYDEVWQRDPGDSGDVARRPAQAQGFFLIIQD